MSPATLERLRRRHHALQATRAFFVERGFLEVDTPALVRGPGLEPHIDPIAVDVRPRFDDAARERRYLITSPELSMKKLLAAGAEKIFQLGHVFRDGERTRRHAPEFMMLEWYRANGTLDDLVRDHEALFAAVAGALDVAAPAVPFARSTVAALFERAAKIDLRRALIDGDLVARVRAASILELRPGADFEDAFFAVMELAERDLPTGGPGGPVVVSRWPAQMAALARACDDDALFAERFEIYAGGLELSNAFDELTDPAEQRARFVDDNAKRARLGKDALPLDEEFLAALAHMPRAAGCALGFDRMLMWLLGEGEIDDVSALPWR